MKRVVQKDEFISYISIRRFLLFILYTCDMYIIFNFSDAKERQI